MIPSEQDFYVCECGDFGKYHPLGPCLNCACQQFKFVRESTPEEIRELTARLANKEESP